MKELQTGNWPGHTLRLFGALHLLFAGTGFYLLGGMAISTATSGYLETPPDPSTPYRVEAYLLSTAISLIFLATLVVAGFFLLRSYRAGVLLSNVLFVLMIVYFVDPVSGFFSPGFAHSMAVVAGAGNVGIGPQIVTGYPVICLIVLNVANYKLRRVARPFPAGGSPSSRPLP